MAERSRSNSFSMTDSAVVQALAGAGYSASPDAAAKCHRGSGLRVWDQGKDEKSCLTRLLHVKFGTGGEASTDESLLYYEALGLMHMRAVLGLNSRQPPPSQQQCPLYIPEPICVGFDPQRGAFIAMDMLEFQYGGSGTPQTALGQGLASLHASSHTLPKILHLNQPFGWTNNLPNYDCEFEVGSSFGFPLDGCCGAARQLNRVPVGQKLNWVEFWRDCRLNDQIEQIKRAQQGEVSSKLLELAAQLSKRLPEFFTMLGPIEDIKPTLLHGDLWSGNVGQCLVPGTQMVAPCIYDPAAYYGHSEADLGIGRMFGGFSHAFWDAYHAGIPKAPGFERRALLYELHHHLNHFNIFGGGYQDGCLRLMKEILKDGAS